jgi:hypothetical protein
MTGARVPPAEADLVAMGKSKLATQSVRAAELEHLAHLLQRDEQVVTLCDALFRSGRQERRGLVADAKRGQLTTLSGGVETQLDRVRPWERAEEIAEHIQADIDGRASSGSLVPGG